MDQERPIEELLRKEAERRRREAPVDARLSPFHRKLLLDEVQRKHSSPNPARSGWRWIGLLPRFAWATALLLVLGGAAWWLLPDHRPDSTSSMTLARKEPVGSTEVAAPATAAMPEAPKAARSKYAVESLDDSARRAVTEKQAVTDASSTQTYFADMAQNRPASPPAAMPTAGPSAAKEKLEAEASTTTLYQEKLQSSNLDKDAVTRVRELAESKKNAGSTGTNPAVVVAALGNGGAFSNSQLYANTLNFNGAQTGAQTVLSNFRVEQSGTEIRIVDNDGSVYRGEIVSAPERYGRAQAASNDRSRSGQRAETLGVTMSRQSPASQPESNLAGDNFVFRVTGTNRSLNQQVTFSANVANYATVANNSTQLWQNVQNQVNSAASVANSQTANQLQNSRISGQVQIGTGAALDVIAVPQNNSK